MKHHKLYGLEAFHLYYYGINIFIGISEVVPGADYVYAYEIDTYEHEGKDVVMFDPVLNVFKAKDDADCIVAIGGKSNGYFNKTMKLYPFDLDGNIVLPIEINCSSAIYKKAEKNWMGNASVLPGIYYATKVCDGTNQSIYELLQTGWEKNDYELGFSCFAQA